MKTYTGIKKYILIAAGSTSLLLGVVGIFIPVLPTTPFLLLTAYLYLRSSKKLYTWLMNSSVFGGYIYSYMTYKAIPKSTKIQAMVILWLGLIISMILVDIWWVRLLLFVVGIGVSTHVLLLNTIDKSKMININRQQTEL